MSPPCCFKFCEVIGLKIQKSLDHRFMLSSP
jgi:hypothetical protein